MKLSIKGRDELVARASRIGGKGEPCIQIRVDTLLRSEFWAEIMLTKVELERMLDLLTNEEEG